VLQFNYSDCVSLVASTRSVDLTQFLFFKA